MSSDRVMPRHVLSSRRSIQAIAAAVTVIASMLLVPTPGLASSSDVSGRVALAAGLGDPTQPLTVIPATGRWGSVTAVTPTDVAAVRDSAAKGAGPTTSLVPADITTARRLLVRFRGEATAGDRADVRRSAGVSRAHISRLVPTVEYWTLPAYSLRPPGATQALMSSPWLDRIEPDVERHVELVPNDTEWSRLWGMTSINAPAAWDRTAGSASVVVAVIDTGIRMDHADLSTNIWRNAAEATGLAGVDDDGNGYVDDIRGWDFVNGDNDPSDDQGHGTHVAGTVAAKGNNGVGVAGVAWNVKVMPLKACNLYGSCYMSDAMRAMEYAVAKGARISNNSYGGFYPASSIEQDVITAAGNQGHLFVAAAGNSTVDNDATPFLPASYPVPNVISVAAIDTLDRLAYFSNYGQTSVHLAAPGDSIFSTDMDGTYSYKSGTSMATPHVAGAAALVASAYVAAGRAWTIADMRSRLLLGSRSMASVAGRTLTGSVLDANFASDLSRAVTPLLTVRLTGTGSGTLTATNGSTTTYGTCSSLSCTIRPGVPAGTRVTLSVVAATGSTFTGWGGMCSGTTMTCAVTMTAPTTSVSAGFRSPLPAGTSVASWTSSASALPDGTGMAWTPMVRTVTSADGQVRATARFYGGSSSCDYMGSDMGGVTIERLVNGAWQQDGPVISPPPALTYEPSSRWFNCSYFGGDMSLSDSGSTLLINLGATRTYAGNSLCGSAVYERGLTDWSAPTILRPADDAECWIPALNNPGWLESEWRTPRVSGNGQRIVVSGVTTARVFDKVSGTWTLRPTLTLYPRGEFCDILSPTTSSMAADGLSFALGFPGCNFIPDSKGGYSGYYYGRVLVYRLVSGSWQLDHRVESNDASTIGTQGMGLAVALSSDGSTLVTTFGRTWGTLNAGTNWTGGAWVLERGAGAWTRVRIFDNPYPVMNSMAMDNIYSCGLLSRTAHRLFCQHPGQWGNNANQGWFHEHIRGGTSWSNAPISTFLFHPDGSAGDSMTLSSGPADLSMVYVRLSAQALVDRRYGAATMGFVLTPLDRSARIPTFTTPVSTSNGFTVNVTNYDPAFTWAVTTSAGRVTRGTASGSTWPLTISSLAAGQSATVTVTTSRSTFASGSGSVTGTAIALLPGRTPTFSVPISVVGGFTVNVTNYDPAFTYSARTSAGTVSRGSASGSNLPFSVSGLRSGRSATLTITVTRTGYTTVSGSVSGTAR